jgi:hypothetical protein
MRLPACALAFAVLLSCAACATEAPRSSAPPAGTSTGGGTGQGTRCITTAGTTCALLAPALVDSACTCDSMYGPQPGKVAP